jgi:toxin ParE1/3/4
VSQCVITWKASRDLDDISEYFVGRNVDAGERLLRSFNEKCLKLLLFPKMGRSYGDLRPGLRGIPLDRYIIFYEVVDDDIIILRVVNGYQNLDALFDK